MEPKSRCPVSFPVSFFVSKRDRDSLGPMGLISFLISLQSRSFRDMSRGVRLSCARLSSRQIYIVYQSEPINRVSLAMYRLKAHRISFSGRWGTRFQTSKSHLLPTAEVFAGEIQSQTKPAPQFAGTGPQTRFPAAAIADHARPLLSASTPISEPSKIP